jgi:hypothetical protein
MIAALITFLFALLTCILDWRDFRRAERPVRWTAIVLLAFSIAVWYIYPLSENKVLPIQWIIRMLEPLVPPGI